MSAPARPSPDAATDRSSERAGRRLRSRAVAAGLVCALVGLLSSWAVAEGVVARDEAEHRRRFDTTAQETAKEIRAAVARYADVLTMSARVQSLEGPLTAAEFVEWGRGLTDGHPGLAGVIFVSSVPAAEVEEFVDAQQAAGDPDFAPRLGVIADEYMIATYTSTGARETVGRDLGDTQERRTAFERARDTGRPAVTAPFTLVSDEDLPPEQRPTSFAMYAPVYRHGALLDTVAQRRAALVGWMATALHGQEFIDAVQVGGSAVTYEILDTSVVDPEVALTLGQWRSTEHDAAPLDVAIDVFGRTWLLRVKPTEPAGGSAAARTWIILFGAGMSCAAGIGVTRELRRRRFLEDVASRATSAAQRADRRFVALVENSSDIICVLADDGSLRYVSPAGTRMLGFGPEDRVVHRIGSLIHPDDRERTLSVFSSLVDDHGRTATAECRLADREGNWHHVEMVATNLVNDPDVAGVVVNVRDVTARTEATHRLSWHASHDALTGLANRALLMKRLSERLRESASSGRGVALLYLDLDRFKTVNDRYGHAAGDVLLTEVAARLERCLRSTDLVARLGGDEFVVLLDGATRDRAVEVAERIARAFREPVSLGDSTVVPAVSIGISIAADDRRDPDEVLREADAALYRAKSSGKGWEIFDHRVRDELARRASIEDLVRRSIDRDAVVTRYQPIVDLSTGTVTAVETFVRLRDDSGALLSPAQFVAVAEDSGLIVELGERVLDLACRTLRTGWDAHGSAAFRRISVNVSARQLDDPGFVGTVKAALERYDLPGAALAIELDERTIIAADGDVCARIEELHAQDVTVIIDDFGSGSSSIASLRKVPVDWVKLDRTIVAGLGTSSRDTETARSVIGIGRSLGLVTIAEGIEDPAQLDVLRELGCDFGQGYLISPPMTGSSVVDLIGNAAATVPTWR